ncbi:MAG: bifunctional DNA primase/polymerase [bacterium]|nr:bifunctional DNA primase/polymerase [bacterium]
MATGMQQNDLAALQRLFNAQPDSNIGIVTGKISNLVVLDIDPRNGGNETFDSLGLTAKDLSSVPMVRTGGGGRHFYFRCPEGGMPKAARLGPGIDIKSDGGIVVAPNSSHMKGFIDGMTSIRSIRILRFRSFRKELIMLLPHVNHLSDQF